MEETRHGSDPLNGIRNGLEETYNRRKNPFSETCKKISSIDTVPIKSLRKNAKRNIRLAFISFPVLQNEKVKCFNTLKDKTSIENIDCQACERQLIVSSNESIETVAKQYYNAVSLALKKHKANIVCINELGFPATEQGPYKDSIEATKKLAQEHEALIIAGSAHDSRTYYNTGHIYHPDSDVYYYHKQVSAVHLNELVSTPSKRKTIYTHAFGLRIAVIICLDIADYSTVAGIVRLGNEIDMILVPAYTDKIEPLEEVAIDTSAAMPGMVALINHQAAGKRSSYLYRFGKIDSKLREIKLPDNGGVLNIYDINVEAFHNEKYKKSEDEKQDQNLKWLFGLTPVMRR